MALREGECFLVRRVAGRGIDKNIGSSRAREDRFNRDRRFADRGNEIGNRDPRDVIKIKRLQQRVRDLEEIKRLRQRVCDLELQRERGVTETESGNIVRDVVNEEEEYPFDPHPPRFYEPIYQQNFSEEEPRFDEDGVEPDEEECSFVRKVLSGKKRLMMVDEGKPLMSDYEKVSARVFGNFLNDNRVVTVDDGCSTVVSCVPAITNLDPSFSSNVRQGLFIETNLSGFQIDFDALTQPVIEELNYGMNIEREENILEFNNGMDIMVSSDKDMLSDKDAPIENGSEVKIIPIVFDKYFCMSSMYVKLTWGLSIPIYALHENFIAPKGGSHKNGDLVLRAHATDKVGPQGVLIYDIGPEVKSDESSSGRLAERNNNDVEEVTCEVKLFRQFVLYGNRVDVPFDPGGFGSKTKLEDEFFFKEGEYDAKISTKIILSFV